VFKVKVDEGDYVSNIKIPEFHGDSYLELPLRRPVGKTLEFEIWLLAKQPGGRSALCSPNNFKCSGNSINFVTVCILPVWADFLFFR